MNLLLDRQEQHLTPLEVHLIHYFSSRPDRVISREQLITDVWRCRPAATERIVDVAISKLRRKLRMPAASVGFVKG
jgi:DNA-binding response OmpR family regulator